MEDPVSYCGYYCDRCPGIDTDCPGCKAGGGDEGCKMRACAQERAVVTCATCRSTSCATIAEAVSRTRLLGEIIARIRAVGIDAWIAEEEALKATKYAFE